MKRFVQLRGPPDEGTPSGSRKIPLLNDEHQYGRAVEKRQPTQFPRLSSTRDIKTTGKAVPRIDLWSKNRIPTVRGNGKPAVRVAPKAPRLNELSTNTKQFSSSKVPDKNTLRTDIPTQCVTEPADVVRLVHRQYEVAHAGDLIDIEQTEDHQPPLDCKDLDKDSMVHHLVSTPVPTQHITLPYDPTMSVVVGGMSGGMDTVVEEIHEIIEEEEDGENECMWDEADGLDRKCRTCGLVMPHLEMLEHIRAYHKPTASERGFPPRPGGYLLCPYPHCRATVVDYEYLIAHLVAYHNQHQFRTEMKIFATDGEFQIWKHEMEQVEGTLVEETNNQYSEDGMSVLGTQRVFYCERDHEWRSKEQSHRVPNVACPASFTVEKMDDGVITASGVFHHLGHKKFPNLLLAPKGWKVPRGSKNFKCNPCRRFFNDQHTLEYHRRIRHGVGAMMGNSTKRLNIICASCEGTFETMNMYIAHVSSMHLARELRIQTFSFDDMQAFETWRHQLEVETMSVFVCSSGKVKATDGMSADTTIQHMYMVCHRSGHTDRYSSNWTTKHPIRKRKSNKMNAFCTAFMNVHVTMKGRVTVKCCLEHFGHDCLPHNLPLSKHTKLKIEEMLKDGNTFDSILFVMKNNSDSSERSHYLKRYEIVNVAKKIVKTEPFVIVGDVLLPEAVANEAVMAQRLGEDIDLWTTRFPRGFLAGNDIFLRKRTRAPPLPLLSKGAADLPVFIQEGDGYVYRQHANMRTVADEYGFNDDFEQQSEGDEYMQPDGTYVDGPSFGGYDEHESEALDAMLNMEAHTAEEMDTDTVRRGGAKVKREEDDGIAGSSSQSARVADGRDGEERVDGERNAQGPSTSQGQNEEQSYSQTQPRGAVVVKNRPVVPRPSRQAPTTTTRTRQPARVTATNMMPEEGVIDGQMVYDTRGNAIARIEQNQKIKTPLLMLPAPGPEDTPDAYYIKCKLKEVLDDIKYEKDSFKLDQLTHLKNNLEARVASLLPQVKSGGRLQSDQVTVPTAQAHEEVYMQEDGQLVYAGGVSYGDQIIEFEGGQYVYAHPDDVVLMGDHHHMTAETIELEEDIMQ